MENSEKKEITIEKSKLSSIFKCLFLSLAICFIILQFGKIYGGSILVGGPEYNRGGFTYENPLNGKTYCETDNDGAKVCDDNFYSLTRNDQLTYSKKLVDFYLPALLGSLIHIIGIAI